MRAYSQLNRTGETLGRYFCIYLLFLQLDHFLSRLFCHSGQADLTELPGTSAAQLRRFTHSDFTSKKVIVQ